MENVQSKNCHFSLVIIILFTFVIPLCSFYLSAQTFTKITEGPLVNDDCITSGSVWGDIDNDGDLDVFMPNAKWQHNLLFFNNGNGSFTQDINSALVSDNHDSKSASWGDYDNDGDLDLFVANEEARNFLYENVENGDFSQITTGIIVTEGDSSSSHSCSWGDFNNDGYLDLCVVNHRYDQNNFGQKNFLYLNNQDGTFSKVTDGPVVTDVGFSLGCSWADYNNDGYLDLFVANSGPAVGHDDNNCLYQNNGDGTFTKIIDSPIVTDGGESRAGSWGDFNNDGFLDLFVANRITGDDPFGYNFLYKNNGNGTFTSITNDPVVLDIGSSYGSSWGDYDNDGDLDLFVANRRSPNFLYENNGDGMFTRITTGSVASDLSDSRGSTWIDFDNDGDLDLFVSNYGYYNDPVQDGENNALYANNGNNNSWLNIRCIGTISNTSAIGTKVRVKAMINGQPVWQLNEISGQTGGGFCAQNSLNTEFGFGDAMIIDSIRIEWPSGLVWDTTNIDVNQFLVIVEKPKAVALYEELTFVPFEFELMQNYPNPFNLRTTIYFSISRNSHVKLNIYNILGELVCELIDDDFTSGIHHTNWNGLDLKKVPVCSGVYLYRIITDAGSITKKMIMER